MKNSKFSVTPVSVRFALVPEFLISKCKEAANAAQNTVLKPQTFAPICAYWRLFAPLCAFQTKFPENRKWRLDPVIVANCNQLQPFKKITPKTVHTLNPQPSK
jgi:hypothetical protein